MMSNVIEILMITGLILLITLICYYICVDVSNERKRDEDRRELLDILSRAKKHAEALEQTWKEWDEFVRMCKEKENANR